MADEQSATKPAAGNPAVAVPQSQWNPAGPPAAPAAPIDNTVAMEGRKAYVVRDGKEFSAIGPAGRRDFQAGETIQLPPETAKEFGSHLYDPDPDDKTPPDMMPPPPPPKASQTPAEQQAAQLAAGQQVPQQTQPPPVAAAPKASPAEEQAAAAAPKPAAPAPKA
jgi:hypothetical protein